MSLPSGLRLRELTAGDTDFLHRLHRATRADELALLAWDDAAKDAFVRMQVQARDRFYRQAFPAARHDLILVEDRPAGRLCVQRSPQALLIVDLALLPEHQGRGIGTALLAELLAEAQRDGVPVRLHVEHANPARRLYERLGFVELADHGTHLLLERAIAPAGAGQPKMAS